MAKTPILTKDGLIKYDNNIKDYINAAIDRVEISGAVTLMGTLGTDGDIIELPPTYKKGEMYQVVTEGEYAGKKCEVGDFVVAVRDNRVTIVGLPEVIYDDFNNHILYQIYNPITNEYDSTIYYVATWESPYNVYGYKNEDEQYKILAFTSCVKYKTENNGITWDVVSVNTLEGLTERESETVNYKVLYNTYPIYNADGTGVIAIPANPYNENSMDSFNADWAVIQGNIEDLVSEGAIYIDPEEETPDIGDIEDVTSAKFVSYNNTTSGIEATNVQEAIDEINELKVNKSDIVDNLESTATDAPLSAKQGKVLNDKVEDYIRENLLIYPYQATNISRDGITFTDNLDGTITVTGTNTSTNTIDYALALRAGAIGVTAKYPIILPAGTYTLSGCPEGGSDSTYWMQIGTDNDDLSYNELGRDYGQGVTFTVNRPAQIGLVINVATGITANNLVFKPMLEVGTVAHEYKPYSDSKLTKGDIVDNLLTGRADLPLSAKQGAVLRKDVDFLASRWITKSTSEKGTVTFDVSEYASFLLFCEWSGASLYSIYYINMNSGIVAQISSNSDAWTVTISNNYTKLNISNVNGTNQWADYRLLRID